MSLAPPLAIGLLLLGSAAGAPFSPKLVQFAKGNVAFAVGITVLLIVLSIGFMPIAVPTLLPLTHVRSWLVAKPLFTVMLPPLVIGLLVKARPASFAERCAPYLRRASTTLLFLTVVLVIASRYEIALRTIRPNALALLCYYSSYPSPLGLRSGALRRTLERWWRSRPPSVIFQPRFWSLLEILPIQQ